MKLSKIEIEVRDGVKFDLTLDEAKSLYNELNKLFGAKVEYPATNRFFSHLTDNNRPNFLQPSVTCARPNIASMFMF